MTLHRLLPAGLSALTLVGCATAPATLSPIPSDREVIAYVTTNWDAYDARFAFLSERRGQSSSPVSVTNVECVADGGDANCTFTVQGRFQDGVVLRRSLDSLFQRQPDGSIEQLIPIIRG